MAFIANPHKARQRLAKVLRNALPEDVIGCSTDTPDTITDAISDLIDEKLLDLENKLTRSGDWPPDY